MFTRGRIAGLLVGLTLVATGIIFAPSPRPIVPTGQGLVQTSRSADQLARHADRHEIKEEVRDGLAGKLQGVEPGGASLRIIVTYFCTTHNDRQPIERRLYLEAVAPWYEAQRHSQRDVMWAPNLAEQVQRDCPA